MGRLPTFHQNNLLIQQLIRKFVRNKIFFAREKNNIECPERNNDRDIGEFKDDGMHS